MRRLVNKWRDHAAELRGLDRQTITTTAAIGWLTQCANELDAALSVDPPPPQLQETKDDVSRVDRSALSIGQDLPRTPQPDGSQ